MRHLTIMLLSAALLFLLACKKSGSSGDTVTYEVKVTQGTWSGDYFDYSGNTQSLVMVNNKPDGWKYTFTLTHGQKAGLVLSAIPDNTGGSTTATANIYVNGKLISTNTDPYGATAQIVINQ